jgi:hypothetical protein
MENIKITGYKMQVNNRQGNFSKENIPETREVSGVG